MENQEKIDLFIPELNLMTSGNIKEFTRFALCQLPDYFFTIPASSTGKYHPKYALGEGGLVRHVKAAVRIAYVMFGNRTITERFSQAEKDMIISALILHDGAKSGVPKTKYTVPEHPVLVCEVIEAKCREAENGSKPVALPFTTRNAIYNLIKSHMGEWNTDRSGKETSPLPISGIQRYVHMCDYLASRKLIDINFEAQV